VLERPAQPRSRGNSGDTITFQPSTEASYASPAHETRPQGLIKPIRESAERR
jgi:hypothetical protein